MAALDQDSNRDEISESSQDVLLDKSLMGEFEEAALQLLRNGKNDDVDLPREIQYKKTLEKVIIEGKLMEWLEDMGEQAIADFEYVGDKIFRIPIEPRFIGDIQDFLEHDYGLKGGAVRELLLIALGRKEYAQPRDIDVVRYTDQKPSVEEVVRDKTIAQRYMPDDVKRGHGVEHVVSHDESMFQSDLTQNMLAWRQGYLYATGACIQDTVRGFIRLTDIAKEEVKDYRKADKLLSKGVRVYLSHLNEWGSADYGDRFFLKKTNKASVSQGVSSFWMAVQIDRAYEVSTSLGDQLVDEYVALGWLEDAKDRRQVILNLENRVYNFGFRNIPIERYERELKIKKHQYDHYDELPTREAVSQRNAR